MSVTTWSNVPDDLADGLSIPTQTQQPGTVNNRVIGGTLSYVNGQQITETATHRASEADIVPSSKGLMGTVRNNGGFHTAKVTPECTVEIPGLGRTSVKVAETMGYLTRTGDGRYVEGSKMGKDNGSSSASGTNAGNQEDPNQMPKDASTDGPELFDCGYEEDYAELIKDVPQGAYDSLIASANAHISEGMDLEGITQKLAPRLASAMGIEPGKAAAMIDEGGLLWQVQADMAVEKRGADPEEFYQWARTNRKNELQQAVNGHLFERSTKGYQEMVDDYFDNTIPTDEALRRHGIPTKTNGDTQMVKLKGHWMSLESAVKARLV